MTSSYFLLLLLVRAIPLTAYVKVRPGSARCSASAIHLADDVTLHYKIHASDGLPAPSGEAASASRDGDGEFGTLSVTIRYEGIGWVAFGVSSDPSGRMIGGEAIVGLPDRDLISSGVANPGKYVMGSYRPDGTRPMPEERQTLLDASIDQDEEAGVTTLSFAKLLQEDGEIRIDVNGFNTFLWAVGHGNALGYHADCGSISLDLSSSYSCSDSVEINEIMSTDRRRLLVAHAVLAGFAWILCAPLGILASFVRDLTSPRPWHRDRDPYGSRAWAKLHQRLNETCFILTVASFSLAVRAVSKSGQSHFRGGHRAMGLAIMLSLPFLWVAGRLLMPPRQKSTPESVNQSQGGGKSVNATETTVLLTAHLEDGTGGSPTLLSAGDGSSKNIETTPTTKSILLWVHRIAGLSIFLCALWEIYSGLELRSSISQSPSRPFTLLFWGLLAASFGIALALKTVVICKNRTDV